MRMHTVYSIAQESVTSADAEKLLGALSQTLEGITGNDGRGSFSVEGLAAFLMARNVDGQAVGCCALRPMDDDPGALELKRMYAAERGCGLGSALLAAAEHKARALGYAAIRLETRLKNREALAFYIKHGYEETPPYGRYVGRPEAICLRKEL